MRLRGGRLLPRRLRGVTTSINTVAPRRPILPASRRWTRRDPAFTKGTACCPLFRSKRTSPSRLSANNPPLATPRLPGMPFADFLRHVRDDLIPVERLRRAWPQARVRSGVRFAGDVRRVQLAAGVTINGPSVLSVENGGGLDGASLEIGPRTYIGEFANIRCGGAPIVIGEDCLIAQHVSIIGTNHDTRGDAWVSARPWKGTGVTIGAGVWLGAGTVVLTGARIGAGVVVAANSVVRGVVAPGTTVAGSPAREVRPSPRN